MSGPGITLTSRPSNDASLDMGLPPHPSRLYGRSGRAALTTRTLGTVGDDAAREDVHGDVEVRDLHGYDPNVMHRTIMPLGTCCEHDFFTRLRRWQAIR